MDSKKSFLMYIFKLIKLHPRHEFQQQLQENLIFNIIQINTHPKLKFTRTKSFLKQPFEIKYIYIYIYQIFVGFLKLFQVLQTLL